MSNNCGICKNPFDSDELAVLKCQEEFCWACLKKYILKNLKPKIKCPNCDKAFIGDVIIRQCLNEEEVQKYDTCCLDSLNTQTNRIVRCLLEECDYVTYTDGDMQFECPVCSMFNCTICKGVHPFMKCSDFEQKKKSNNSNDRKEVRQMEEAERKRAKNKILDLRNKRLEQETDELEKLDIISSFDVFTCSICTKVIAKGQGVSLRNCGHHFCKPCLRASVDVATIIPIKCPGDGCKAKLQDREILGILTPDQFDKYIRKTVEVTKSKCSNLFHCKTPDCDNFVIIESEYTMDFTCKKCNQKNCIRCCAIHKKGENCETFKGVKNEADELNERYIKDQIKKGLCMECTKCKAIIKKDGGCNWVKCPACHLELCWIMKMPRWGPKGKGDISGGCRCGVNNKLCSPNCLFGCMPEDEDD